MPQNGGRSQSPRPCALSRSWTVKQQCVDLLAEGLWEELLDDQQPDITVMDWYVLLPQRVARRGSPKNRPLSVLPFGLSFPPGPSCHSRCQPCPPLQLLLSDTSSL